MSLRSEQDLSCPICHDIFKDPVVLSCSHSFCKTCLHKWWRGKKVLNCPCCKRRSSKTDPPSNLALRNICETYVMEREQRTSAQSESLCSLHSETLRLYCLDHQQPVCVVCRDARAHNNHRFRPIDEAAQDCREEVQKSLKSFQEKLELYKQVKEDCAQTAKYIKVQAQHTERQIKETFQKLHQFLQAEEKARITDLKEEERQKSQMMKEKIEGLSRNIAAISDTIRATENELRAGDVSVLQNYRAAVRRMHQHPLLADPEVVSGTLIDVVKHLGNLTFNIWNKMKQLVSYTSVILDPNTADPELIVSDDLSSVRSGERLQLPKNPERTKFSCSALSSEGFTSGTHSWDVDVGNNKDWELGLLTEYLDVNGRLQSGLWRIMFSDGKFTAFSTLESEKDLPVRKVKKIRVHLDFGRGKLSFSDFDTNTLIHTFQHKFSDTVFPYMYTESPSPLKILPVKVSVTVEKHN
ncbi:tripartite motif-containing protein 35-like [Parambassis ranga]|uniref:Tripartite motif-containing protein 35-like n=1 Tax=Parambassis ranga TaxID=210632 RepID=A0A6P7HZE3_9TELE|nr:tripartite motif-containing protein 35-like [Parambassis ranga]